jgi:uncharacterized damage-inducible protein DinB
VDRRIAVGLELLDPATKSKPWYGGPTLLGALRQVKARAAAWKPPGGGHSIWELTLHAAYWKYAVLRHFAPDIVDRFPRSPSNWPAVPESTDEKAWTADVKLLREQHQSLVAAIQRFPAKRLDEISPAGKKWTFSQLLFGIATHDIYHIGQIQTLKRMAAVATRRAAR